MIKKSKIIIPFIALLPKLAFSLGYIGLSSGVVVNTSDTSMIANYRGVPVTVFGGYGTDMSGPFYLGGELFVTPVTGKLSSSAGNDLKTTYGYGLSFIPGIQLSEHTLGYARLGIVRTQFESHNQNVNGAQFGLGLDTSMTPHWSLRGEYTVTAYADLQNISNLRADQFSLGAIYRF